MTKPFTETIVGHTVTESIYVKADGRTVCGETDKDVSEMKYAKGERLTEAQVKALIFPGAVVAEPVPDAEQRSAETPDAERRGGKRT